jgi:hypothetical protein
LDVGLIRARRPNQDGLGHATVWENEPLIDVSVVMNHSTLPPRAGPDEFGKKARLA